MNYQGVLVRKDVVGALCVLWYLVTYYPVLSVGLILCLLVTTFWETSVKGGRVIVSMFQGKVGKNQAGAIAATGNYQHNLVMTQTTVEQGSKDQTEILIDPADEQRK